MDVVAFVKNHLSLVLIAVIFLLILIVSWNYVFLGIFAVSIAVIVLPLHRRFTRRIPAPLSAGVLTTMVMGIIIGICVSVVVVLASDFSFLVSMIHTIISSVTSLLHIPVGSEAVSGMLSGFSDMLTSMFPSMAMTAAKTVPAVVIDFILFYALLYLIIILGDKIWGDIWSVIPASSRENVGLMAKKTKDILFSLYVVHIFIAVLTFFLAAVFFILLGYGHVMFFAMLCAVCALIPVLGPLMVIIFVGVYALALGDWYGVILTATLGYFLTCVVTDLLLRPRLTAKRVKIRPMLMFVGFFGGAMALGLLGFVMGPVLLVLGMTGYEIFFKEMHSIHEEEI